VQIGGGGYDVLGALAVAASLVVGLAAREYGRALAADRLGDASPRRWGRLTPNPAAWADPFGTVILPALLVALWAAGLHLPPFAYAKPLPLDTSNLRRYPRDVVLVSLAGPLVNVALAVVAGVLVRLGLGSASGTTCVALSAFVLTNVTLAVFHLLPIPGLDGARMLALVMSPRAREVYRNLDQYLILFVLLIFFLLGGIALSIVEVLRDALLDVVVGGSGC
jgi:Zn-dependent protease